MRHWFLSFNSSDRALAERLKASIERKDAGSHVFFDATSLRAGGYWQPALAKGIDEADAFVLLVGEKGLGPWQTLEYYEAQALGDGAPFYPRATAYASACQHAGFVYTHGRKTGEHRKKRPVTDVVRMINAHFEFNRL
jgi:hypothetical protein